MYNSWGKITSVSNEEITITQRLPKLVKTANMPDWLDLPFGQERFKEYKVSLSNDTVIPEIGDYVFFKLGENTPNKTYSISETKFVKFNKETDFVPGLSKCDVENLKSKYGKDNVYFVSLNGALIHDEIQTATDIYVYRTAETSLIDDYTDYRYVKGFCEKHILFQTSELDNELTARIVANCILQASDLRTISNMKETYEPRNNFWADVYDHQKEYNENH
ncbi:hypothetical protein [Bacillus wiedmannii]|uniref:hypothetical protein n=1 Tax=Bacillus wiedmannii TaxID=1890302 RepID=UPI003D98A54D